MQHIATNYFIVLFESRGSHNGEIILETSVERRVINEMNQLLTKFKAEEIVFALKQMHPSETPGTNGLSAMLTKSQRDGEIQGMQIWS